MQISINDIPDKVLADMVRSGCYAKNTLFGSDDSAANAAKYLLVLSIPYGPSDEVNSMVEAVESFLEFVDSEDSVERMIQVLSVRFGKLDVTETSYEVLECNSIRCSICNRSLDNGETAHLHQGSYIGDECCWDERLRSSE